jgi:hypothetical protein
MTSTDVVTAPRVNVFDPEFSVDPSHSSFREGEEILLLCGAGNPGRVRSLDPS